MSAKQASNYAKDFPTTGPTSNFLNVHLFHFILIYQDTLLEIYKFNQFFNALPLPPERKLLHTEKRLNVFGLKNLEPNIHTASTPPTSHTYKFLSPRKFSPPVTLICLSFTLYSLLRCYQNIPLLTTDSAPYLLPFLGLCFLHTTILFTPLTLFPQSFTTFLCLPSAPCYSIILFSFSIFSSTLFSQFFLHFLFSRSFSQIPAIFFAIPTLLADLFT